MNASHSALCEKLKQLGYAKNHKLRMYGEEFDLVSDPQILTNQQVIVDAVVRKSGSLRRLSIPLSVVQMIRAERRVA